MGNLTPTDYDGMIKTASPKTKSYKTIPLAFVIGGAICVIGQLLIELFKNNGWSETIAGTLASVSLVVMSAFFTGINLYDNIAKLGGAGTLVPITGFANAIASPALEFKAEGYILGLGAKMFVISGPVIVYGTLASVVYGVLVFAFNL